MILIGAKGLFTEGCYPTDRKASKAAGGGPFIAAFACKACEKPVPEAGSGFAFFTADVLLDHVIGCESTDEALRREAQETRHPPPPIRTHGTHLELTCSDCGERAVTVPLVGDVHEFLISITNTGAHTITGGNPTRIKVVCDICFPRKRKRAPA